MIDRIVPEPLGGAHRDHKEAARILREILIEELEALSNIKPKKLVEMRIEKYRKMGFWEE